MSSPSIVIRNRANAAHSTGPVSAQGKARSAQNALKLGLSIQRHVILDYEDPAAFQALHTDLLRIYGPRTEREETAVQEIAHCQWAFRRFDIAEHNVLNRHPMDPFTFTSIENPYLHREHRLARLHGRRTHAGWRSPAGLGVPPPSPLPHPPRVNDRWGEPAVHGSVRVACFL